MPAASFLHAFYLMTSCQPRCDRALYRNIRKAKPRRIVELGIGDASRAVRMISLAKRYCENEKIKYTGIDLFEARSTGTPCSLKQAHHRLAPSSATVRLVPGELLPALARTANLLGDTDLIVIDAEHTDDDLSQVWFYLPRMLHAETQIARYELRRGMRSLVWLSAADVRRHHRAAA